MPDAPAPHDTLSADDMTAYWLDSSWSFDDIADEWDWLFEDSSPRERLGEIWLRPRWTTDAERADPDALYDLFGVDREDVDTSVYYEQAKPGSPGAYRYWTTEVPAVVLGEKHEVPDGS